MLVARQADMGPVIHRALVLIAFVCCALVIASFGLFALDQISGASKHQQSEIAAGTTTTAGTTPTPAHHAQPRRFIDGAWRALTSPFRSVVKSDSDWVDHIVPTLFALLVYGVGLGFLARYSRGLS
jgi:hypothetical protein